MSRSKKDYVKIGKLFLAALEQMEITSVFRFLIKTMERKPELPAKMSDFDELVLAETQNFLSVAPSLDGDKWSSFAEACSLLEG